MSSSISRQVLNAIAVLDLTPLVELFLKACWQCMAHKAATSDLEQTASTTMRKARTLDAPHRNMSVREHLLAHSKRVFNLGRCTEIKLESTQTLK